MRAWFADEWSGWSSQLLRTEATRAAARVQLASSAVEDTLEAV